MMRPKPGRNCSIMICLAMFMAFLAAPGVAQTTPPDVALVTMLSGEVSYWNDAEKIAPARMQAFMKVRRGDHLKLPGAASLTLLYFAGGRQETWRGPVSLIAGDRESAPAAGQEPPPQPEVRILPTKVTKQIAGAPLPAPSSMGRSGVIQTMAPTCPPPPKPPVTLSKEAQQRIQEAERTYQDLRKRAGVEDVTPELYFLGVLADYQQYPKMEKFVDAMLAKRPGDPSLEKLKAWVRSQAAAQK